MEYLGIAGDLALKKDALKREVLVAYAVSIEPDTDETGLVQLCITLPNCQPVDIVWDFEPMSAKELGEELVQAAVVSIEKSGQKGGVSKEKTIADLMGEYSAAEKALWARFGVKNIGCSVTDYTKHLWYRNDGEIVVTGDPKATTIDVDMDDDLYTGELYGTSEWKCEGFTMFVVDGGGDLQAWLFTSAKRVSLDDL